ncbi:hypothetical protein CYMTET_6053 [Cymbomonas tetramitiformis]|uniref:Uncharacterized protein n=1 Tax=Cymbomonas tetramitiformis TaxID=36881 RepID=A0AAE0GY86_9CHLO|nr:hypothetical protein CYMTET_6053 [Cymbomonas tetramitiformis]
MAQDPSENVFHHGGLSGPENFDWGALKQVSQAEQEKVQLQMELEAKDRELAAVRSMMEGGANFSSAEDLIRDDVKGSKLTELAKKNRQVTLALEREKAKTAKLSSELAQANAQQKLGKQMPPPDADPESIQGICRQMVEEAADEAEEARGQMTVWKEKYTAVASRMEKESSKQVQLKADLDKMKRVLKAELGEDVPLERALEGGEWRGRAQQISLLKEKVKDLKEKLLQAGEGGTGAAGGAATVAGGGVTGSGEDAPPVRKAGEALYRKNIEKLEKDRKSQIEKLESELDAAREEATAAKKRQDAATARKSAVEAELKSLKGQIHTLIEKTENDDKLINALRTELTKARKQGGGAASEGGSGNSGSASHRAVSGRKEKFVGSSAQALEGKLAEQESVIQQLETQIKRQEMIIGALQQQVAAGGSGPGNDEDIRVLEVETEKLEELVALFKTRLMEEEATTANLTQQLQNERIKVIDFQRRLEGSRPSSAREPPQDKVSMLENEVVRQSSQVHRLQEEMTKAAKKAEEELGLYRAMLQQMRSVRKEPGRGRM